MYDAFFQLQKKPFELVPDPEFLYLGRSHKKALTYLDYGIRERSGFILLTGEVGSGKTTLIRETIGKAHPELVPARLFHTAVSSKQLLELINLEFGLEAAGRGKVALLRELNDFLAGQYAAGKQPVVVIDEAQNLGAELLEELRLLSNLENPHNRVLQIILVGQPELRRHLAEPALLPLRQRITINCHLTPLTREELAGYVVHRLTVAGNAAALEFPPASLDLIFRHSRGIPRLVNIICQFVMVAACAEESRAATLEMVRDVMEELDVENNFWGGALSGAAAAVPAVVPAAAGPSGGEAALVQACGRLDALEQESRLQLSVSGNPERG